MDRGFTPAAFLQFRSGVASPYNCYKGALNRGNLLAQADTLTNLNFLTIQRSIEDRLDRDLSAIEDDLEREQAASFQRQDEAFFKAYQALIEDNYRVALAGNPRDSVFFNDRPYEGTDSPLPDIRLFPLLTGLDEQGDYQVSGSENYRITARALGSGDQIS